nr:unnamed protein product [Spirometra erinaceieuropaei]
MTWVLKPSTYRKKTSDFDENANKTETNEDINRLQLISSSDHGNHILPMSEHETTVFSRVSPVRGQCLIIQGLPESTAGASKERVSAALKLFQCLLNELLRPNEEVSVLKAFRLGKRSIDISEHSRPRPLKIVLANQEQSILPKLDELKIHICDLSPDIVSLTETWLSENVDDRELMLPGFQLFRRDRRERQGGGVVTYVKHGLLVSEKTEQFACSTETIWLNIRVPGSHSLEVLTVYRPPRSDPEADARLLEELGRFALRPDVLIMGDFNAPLIDWSSLYARGPELAFDRGFLDLALRSFLTQHVLFPTRVREGQQSNCLDLVLTKSMDSIDEASGDVEISEDGEKAEHFSQFFKSIFTSESPFTPHDYDFDEGPKIESVSFDEATVRKELMTLNESKSPGPDDIPPKLLKELAAELAKPLSMLFQASF